MFSAGLDLNCWSVDAIQQAKNYNSVRSNKNRNAVGTVPDEIDGETESGFGIEYLELLVGVDGQLRVSGGHRTVEPNRVGRHLLNSRL